MMTIAEAEATLQHIANAGDPDAHIKEDEFREAVLREVVAGNPDAVELARIALRTSQMTFSRWYE